MLKTAPGRKNFKKANVHHNAETAYGCCLIKCYLGQSVTPVKDLHSFPGDAFCAGQRERDQSSLSESNTGTETQGQQQQAELDSTEDNRRRRRGGVKDSNPGSLLVKGRHGETLVVKGYHGETLWFSSPTGDSEFMINVLKPMKQPVAPTAPQRHRDLHSVFLHL